MASSSGTNDSANSLPSLSLASEKLVDGESRSTLSKRTASEDEHDCAAIHKKIRELKLGDRSHLDYKSGATYEGQVKDNCKFGYGEFGWPNGDKYVGEFRLNTRHGYGCQWWNDGSCYEGYFHEDKRSGHGVHKWKKGEVGSPERQKFRAQLTGVWRLRSSMATGSLTTDTVMGNTSGPTPTPTRECST